MYVPWDYTFSWDSTQIRWYKLLWTLNWARRGSPRAQSNFPALRWGNKNSLTLRMSQWPPPLQNAVYTPLTFIDEINFIQKLAPTFLYAWEGRESMNAPSSIVPSTKALSKTCHPCDQHLPWNNKCWTWREILPCELYRVEVRRRSLVNVESHRVSCSTS